MKSCCILLAIVVCLLAVDGKNIHEKNTDSDNNENVDVKHLRNRPERRMRSRRNSYKYNDYGNSYQNIESADFLKSILYSVREIETHVKHGIRNSYPGYYDNRHDYSNKCEESVNELLSLYKELVLHLKYTPTPQPQIIYIPYIVPTNLQSPVNNTPAVVYVAERINVNDKNRVWMDTPKNTGTEDDGDGSRPISFRPIRPKAPIVPPPPFEHGSTQAGMETTPATLKKPVACAVPILSCCGYKSDSDKKNCFALHKCSKSYETGLACNPEIIKRVLEDFSKMYGPLGEF